MEKDKMPQLSAFPIGEENTIAGQYFIGQSYVAPLTLEQVPTFNVTFEPGCRNNWHIHHADKGGGQLLICIYGRGWYQEWGKDPQELHPGDVVNIPANVKHWHGAAVDSWFQHIAQSIPAENGRTEWCEAVDNEQYSKLKQSRGRQYGTQNIRERPRCVAGRAWLYGLFTCLRRGNGYGNGRKNHPRGGEHGVHLL